MFVYIKRLWIAGEVFKLRLEKPESINRNGVPRSLLQKERPVIQIVLDVFTDEKEGDIYKIHRREQVDQNKEPEDRFFYVVVPAIGTDLRTILELADFALGNQLKKESDEINTFFNNRWQRLVDLYRGFDVEMRECFRIELSECLSAWPPELKGVHVPELEIQHPDDSLERAVTFLRTSGKVVRGNADDFPKNTTPGTRLILNGESLFLMKTFAEARVFVNYRRDGTAVYVVVRN